LKTIRLEQGLAIELFVGRNRIPDLQSKKADALLKFLVSHAGTRFSRTSLQKRFWGGANSKNAQLSLRQALFLIGQALQTHSPIRATRTQVFCRASKIYVSRKPFVKAKISSPRFQLEKGQDERLRQIADLISLFRRQNLGKFVLQAQRLLNSQSLDKSSEFSLRFFLACTHNELGRYQEGLRIASAMVGDANSSWERTMAFHALGGILWHGGYFDEGLPMLWEAFNLSSGDPSTQFHILSNIAIGSFEANRLESVQYAVSLANSQPEVGTEHHEVRRYIRMLELVSQGDFATAQLQMEQYLKYSSRVSSRVDVYLYELMALVEYRMENPGASRFMLSQAELLRKAFDMHRSPVETRRIQSLMVELDRCGK
jgi:hypothetical protein